MKRIILLFFFLFFFSKSDNLALIQMTLSSNQRFYFNFIIYHYLLDLKSGILEHLIPPFTSVAIAILPLQKREKRDKNRRSITPIKISFNLHDVFTTPQLLLILPIFCRELKNIRMHNNDFVAFAVQTTARFKRSSSHDHKTEPYHLAMQVQFLLLCYCF